MALLYIPTFVTRVDAAPLDDDDFSFSFNSWISNMVDSLNYSIEVIQDNFNGFNTGVVVGSFTSADITSMAPGAPDGTIWYSSDHVPPCLVVKINGALRQILTAAFP